MLDESKYKININMSQERLEKIVRYTDLGMQTLCSQISHDYLKFIKTNILNGMLEYHGLNLSQMKILTLTESMPRKFLNSAKAADFLRMDAAAIARGVAELIKKDMIQTTDDPYDSRAKILSVTMSGQSLVDAYRSRCIDVIAIANSQIHFEDEDTFINEGYAVFNKIVDRAKAFSSVKFRQKQTFYEGMGRASVDEMPSDKTLKTQADFVFQVLASQVSLDYLNFIRKFLISDMQAHGSMKLRELRALMCIDFYGQEISSADIANVMRIEPATVSRAIKILLDDGMVFSIENKFDARSRLICLTEKGQAYADKYKDLSVAKVAAVEAHFNCYWDMQTRAQVLTGLDNIRQRSAQLASLKVSGDEPYSANNVADVKPQPIRP